MNFFLIQASQPVTIKGRDFSKSLNPYTPYWFSSVESLLYNSRGRGCLFFKIDYIELSNLNSDKNIQ